MNFTKDSVWGWVLIACGVASITFRPFDKLDAKLHGAADTTITVALLLLAAGAVLIAMRGDPSLKAAALSWFVLP